MPIDKDGNIISHKPQKKHIGIKDVCLIISTILSVVMTVLYIQENALRKIQYKEIMKEHSMNVTTSYIVCHIDYTEALFETLKNENKSVKISANELSEMFYDNRAHIFLEREAFLKRDIELEDTYIYPYPEVVFLKIEVYGGQQLYNCTLNYTEIAEEKNLETCLRSLKDIERNENIFKKENCNTYLGDITSNELILIPIAIKYREGYSYDDQEIADMSGETIYRKIYVPHEISFYDGFLEKNIVVPVRDLLDNNLITEFFYEELG